MRLPPFARQLDPDCREIWIYIGSDCWTAARYRAARRLPVLLLPPNQSPEPFRWPVAGKETLLIQQGRFDILQIPVFANVLFRHGASIVRCIYGPDSYFVSYERNTYAKAS